MNLQAQSSTDDASIEYEPSDEYDGDGTTLHLPSSTQPETSWYWGAITDTVVPGKHTHVVYPDLSALYPSIILGLNVSPDTLIGTEDDLVGSEYTEDDCIWSWIDSRPVKHCADDEDWSDFKDSGYKAVEKDESIKWKAEDAQYDRCFYLRHDVKQGFITDVVSDLIERKNDAKGTDLYAATKAFVNAAYGTLGYSTDYNTFRLFDNRLAESVSMMGRKVLRYTMNEVVAFAEREYDTDAYIVLYDTDGVGISFDVATQSEALTIVHDATEYLRTEGYGQFLLDNCGYTEDLLHNHQFAADVEYYAESMYVHSASKRYSKLVKWDEGEDVDEIEVTGFECIRSDVATVTIDVQERVFDFILRHNLHDVKQDVYEYVSGLMDDIESGDVPLEDIGVRAGIGQELNEYGSASRRPQPQYRGAKYADAHIDSENLGEASKPYVFPIEYVSDDDLPKRYSANTAEDGDAVDAIAVEDPTTIEDRMVVDRAEVARKQVRDRVAPIFQNLDGYSWQELETGTVSTTMDEFM